MEKRIHLYVSRKNFGAWLMALCMLASVVLRILVYVKAPAGNLCVAVILPVIATLLFVAICLLAGKEMFYKSALAVWLLGISGALRLYPLLQGSMLYFCMACVCILFFCVFYTQITSGKIRYPWLLFVMYVAVALVLTHIHRKTGFVWELLPDILLFAGLLVLLFAIKVHTDNQYHPTWGDRGDGRKIRSIPAMDQIGPYIMVKRNESNNLFEESVEITELERYVRRKRREGLTNFGLTHVIIASYVRTVAKYPALNRFIAGQKLYSHGEDIALCMTVKKEMSADSPDTVIKVHFSPRDTAEDIYRKFNEQVEAAKDVSADNGVDNTAGILSLIPGLVLKFVVWLLRVLDYLGWLPGFLMEISPFHGSAYFTSMGSLGIHPVYHHLYDFGTIPVFCSFGRKRRAEELVDGEPVERKYVDLRFNLDERICDGYYYAAVIKHFTRTLRNPSVLDEAPETIVKDIP